MSSRAGTAARLGSGGDRDQRGVGARTGSRLGVRATLLHGLAEGLRPVSPLRRDVPSRDASKKWDDGREAFCYGCKADQHRKGGRRMTTDQASGSAAGDRRAVSAFIAKLRASYDVLQTIMFGSRARGENRPDSDLDLAVVLNGKRGDFIDTKLDMAGLAFDVLMETGVLVQAFPMWEDDLAHPEQFPNPALIRTIDREGIRLE